MSLDFKKKVFLIISGRPGRAGVVTDFINKHYDQPTIYTAPSGNIGFLKIANAKVDVVIADSENNTADAIKIIEAILNENFNPNMAVIVIGHPPEEERFLDELVTGRVSFIESTLVEDEFSQSLTRALNFTSHNQDAPFYLRYLSPGDVLIKEGDSADFVYILKSGQLRAFTIVDGKKVVMGNIEVGEFVGEMSYINNEPRSASIEAITDAQLIEVPIGHVDKILYKRPAWSKALMQTLSKRLKSANKIVVKV